MQWISIPQFKLVENNGMWNVFECIEYGKAIFADNDSIITLDFPLGWQTDIATTPLWARSFLSQTGPHAPAALVHDRALNMGLSRKLARKIMWSQLNELPLVGKRKYLMYFGIAFYDSYVAVKSLFGE